MSKLRWIAVAVVALCASACQVDDTYSECVDNDDCSDPEDVCYAVDVPAADTNGSFCSHPCDTAAGVLCEENFGRPGACYQIEAADPICFQTCLSNRDCYSASECVTVTLTDGRMDAICLPDVRGS